ncbi:MAG: hypothetical protein ACI4JF_06925 [Oscillospiraceae bacterium]
MDYAKFHRETNIINFVGGTLTAVNQLLLGTVCKDSENTLFGILPMSVTGIINFVRKLIFINSEGFDQEAYKAAEKDPEAKKYGIAAVAASCAALAATIFCICARSEKCEDQ